MLRESTVIDLKSSTGPTDSLVVQHLIQLQTAGIFQFFYQVQRLMTCFSLCGTDVRVCVYAQAPLRENWRRQRGPLNMNHYANKKSAAESMLDVALLMANASQLKAVLEQGPNFTFYAPLVTLISISLILQIVVGVMLIFIGKLSSLDEKSR